MDRYCDNAEEQFALKLLLGVLENTIDVNSSSQKGDLIPSGHTRTSTRVDH